VLALRVTREPGDPVIVVATMRDVPGVRDEERQYAPLCTGADGTWRAIDVAADDLAWTGFDADDRSWSRLRKSRIKLARLPDKVRWRYEQLARIATPLELPDGPTILIRKRFRTERSRR
jgi:hypothetical protein